MPTIQFRTDESTKARSAEIFHQLGITMSDALNMFLRQSIVHGGLPFTPVIQTRQPSESARREKLSSLLDFSSKNRRIEKDFKFERDECYEEQNIRGQ